MARRPKKDSAHRPFEGLKKLAADRKESARAVAAAAMAAKRAPKPPAEAKAAPKSPPPPKSPPSAPPAGEAPAGYSYEDRVAFNQALAGVRPLGAAPPPKRRAKRPAAPKTRQASVEAERAAAEEAARARLDQLVGGGVEFVVDRSDGVEGRRRSASGRTVRLLRDGKLAPEATLDLHGLTRQEAGPKIRAFVRDAHRRGRRTVAVVHGKGIHSEGGVGVLREVVVEVLSRGGAAPLVDAFATAPARFGGEGAILVRLR